MHQKVALLSYGEVGNTKKQPANALKLTPQDMLKEKLIDGVIEEPLGGAHYDPEAAYQNVKKTILSNIKSLKNFNKEE